MLAYILRRLGFGIAVLAGTSIITFLIAFVVPADPAVTIAGAVRSWVWTSRFTSNTDATLAALCTATWAAPTFCVKA
jgi:ABC-type dipeptide/oligopeptide/nickel transport system permease component